MSKIKQLTNEFKELNSKYRNLSLEERNSPNGKQIEFEINNRVCELKLIDKNIKQHFEGSMYGNYKSNLINELSVSLDNEIDKQLNLMKKRLDKFIKQELNKN